MPSASIRRVLAAAVTILAALTGGNVRGEGDFGHNPTAIPAESEAQASSGLDSTFGAGGIVDLHTDSRVNEGVRVAPLPDGGLIAAGISRGGPGDSRLLLAGFNADATLRSDFGIAGLVMENSLGGAITTVAGLIRLGDGRLVVAGTVEDQGTSFFAARLLADGSFDPSFGGGFRSYRAGGSLNIAHALAVQPDGAVLVGGTADNVNVGGDQVWALMRVTPTGLLDTSFGSGGFVTESVSPVNRESVNGILVQTDGRIVVAGGADDDRLHLARYMPNGARDGSFGTNGIYTNYNLGPASAIVAHGTGFLVAGNHREGSYLQQFHMDGSLDATLGVQNPRRAVGFIAPRTLQRILDLALYPNGKIAVAGSMDGRFALGVHNPDLSWDAGFADGGIARIDALGEGSPASALALSGDDRIVAIGSAGRELGVGVSAVAPRFLVVAHEAASEQFAVSFSAARFDAAETGGAASIEVRLGAPSATEVTVDYATSDGTATAGADYVAASGSVVFAPGETRKSFQVQILPDSAIETTWGPEGAVGETVLLTLTNAVGAVIGRPNPASIMITDAPYAVFATEQTLAAEASGSAKVMVTLNGPSALTSSVDYAIIGGSATPGADFILVSGTLTFAPNQVFATIDVPLVNDGIAETEETIVLTLSHPVNIGLVPGHDTTTIVVVDDPATCTVCSTVIVGEREGSFILPVDLPFVPVPGGVIRVAYATSDGTATAGADYRTTSGTLLFASGLPGASPTHATIEIPILSDRIYDPNETFLITFSGDAIPSIGPLVVVRIVDASIVVGTTTQSGSNCTLDAAIRSANQDSAIGGCTAGLRDDVIFVPAGTYVLSTGSTDPITGPTALPVVEGRLEIRGAGPGATIIRRDSNGPDMRFFLNAGELWLAEMTLAGGRVGGGWNGGAVSGGPVHADHVVFDSNSVTSHDARGGAVAANFIEAIDSVFRNNAADQGGGGAVYGRLTATGSTFIGNHAQYGGAVDGTCFGSVAATRSAFSGNSATQGGAIYVYPCPGIGTSIALTDSVFDSNTASSNGTSGGGGAIFANASFNVTRSRFLNNTAPAETGGAIAGTMTGSIADSTFADNSARWFGGAISDDGPSSARLTISGSTFARNRAGDRGGALAFRGPSVTLRNSTLSANESPEGGAIWAQGAGSFHFSNLTITGNTSDAAVFIDARDGSADIANSIIAGNAFDVYRASGTVASLGHNLIGANADYNGMTWDATDLIGTSTTPSIDPRLGPLQNNGGPTETHMLLADSPAIDRGNSTAPGSAGSCEATDQRGRTRPGEGTPACDIGAVERQITSGPDLSVQKRTTSVFGYVGQPMVYRITVVNNGGAAATGVVISDPVPAAQMTVTTATVSQGSCLVTGSLVTCTVPVLGPGQSATADVTVIPLVEGLLSNNATVMADGTGVVPPGGLPASGDAVARVPIRVTTTLQVGGPNECSLSDAIRAHNTRQPVSGCRAGTGRDLILLPAGTYLMTEVGFPDPNGSGPAALPGVQGQLEIRGEGVEHTFLVRDAIAPSMRFFSNAAELWLAGMTLTGGQAGADRISEVHGGAVSGGTIHTDQVVFENNTVTGAGARGGAVDGYFIETNSSLFRNNTATQGSGGAVYGSLTATGSTFIGNQAQYGGAVNEGCFGSLAATASTFIGNSASVQGGAIYSYACNGRPGVIALTDSAFDANTALEGGAIWGNAAYTVTRTQFLNNRAERQGGAISGQMTGAIADSRFTDNAAGLWGGAVLHDANSPNAAGFTITGSTFARNTAGSRGGALALHGPSVTVRNSTLSANGSPEGAAIWVSGGGPFHFNNLTVTGNTSDIAVYIERIDQGAVDIANSIIAGNAFDVGRWSGTLTSLGHNIIGANADWNGTTWDATDRIGTSATPSIDPLLGPLQNNGGLTETHALMAGSPALDAGSLAVAGTGNGACEATDQRGVARPGQGTTACDIGAFEAEVSVATADLALMATASPDPSAVGGELTYTVEVRNLGPANASGIDVSVARPAGARIVSAVVTQGTNMQPDGQVIFNVGTLNAGASATLTVVVVPTTVGPLAFTASVTAIQPDPNPTNGTVTTTVAAERSADLVLSRVNPARGGNDGFLLVTLEGKGIEPDSTITLERSGEVIVARFFVADPAGLTGGALFELSGHPLGRYDVVATNRDGRSARLPEGFTVEAATRPDVYVDVLGPGWMRPGQTAVFQIVIGNRGNADAYGIPFYIDMPGFAGSSARSPIGHPPALAEIPPEITIDYSQVPQTIRVVNPQGEPRQLVPLVIPVLRSGARRTFSVSIAIPASSTATSFTLGSYAHRSIVVPLGPAGTVPQAQAGGADMSSGPAAGMSFAALDQAPPANSSCNFGLNPGFGTCLTDSVNFLMNLAGTFAGPAAGCVIQAAGKPLGMLMSICSVASSGGPDDSFLPDSLQSFGMAAVGIAASCAAGVASSFNLAMGIFQTGLSLLDMLRDCAGVPIETSVYKNILLIRSGDPNAKSGSVGTGNDRFVTGAEPLRYSVLFENKPDATAPAQDVVITDQLDTANLDLSSFSFGPVRFGNTDVTLPADQIAVTKDVDLRPVKNLIVRIRAVLEPVSGLLTWRFTSLDPQTGEPTTDALSGFLPPNVNTPEGDGSVTFFVQSKPGLPTGTPISNSARIVFDVNAPIDTNTWMNTIDNTPPSSHVSPLATEQPGSQFTVSWSGTDEGSGVRDYTVFVADGNWLFTEWQTNTTATSAAFTGQPGHIYRFYSVARDLAYNRELKAAIVEATTRVLPVSLAFEHSTYAVLESAGSATIAIVRSGNTGDAISVDYMTTGATATAGQDYTETTGTVTFASGETTKIFAIPILPDSTREPDETVQIALSFVEGAQTYSSYAVLTILDDEPPALTLPPSMTVEATAAAGAIVTFGASASSHVDTVVTPGCSPASGSLFPLGGTTVTCTATDSRGSHVSDHFTITVVDTTLPTLSCAAADGLWHADNVSVACAAADPVSGLASASDAVFTLVTTVPSGAETAGASTGTLTVCDRAGNCAIAGPIGGHRIDRKAPAITIASPTSTVYATGVTVRASYACQDAGSGVAGCVGSTADGAAIDTSTIGAHTFTVTAADRAGNTSTISVGYTVAGGSEESGRMYGTGDVERGKVHHHFVFRVTDWRNRESGRLEYWISDPRRCGDDEDDQRPDHDGDHERDYGRDHGNPQGRFEATSVTEVTFSDDPAFGPGRSSRDRPPSMDTVRFGGTGKWNGRSGYTFEAMATDQGEPGRHRDTFSLVVKDSRGHVVATVSGALDGGNIQSTRLNR